MKSSLLDDRAVLAISGDDARDFLQGLITKDARAITPGTPVFAALLSPQGKFLFDFFIVEHEGRLLIDTDKSRLPELIKRLTMYRLRSKVEFTSLPQMQVGAVWESPSGNASNLIMYADPRFTALGLRIIGENIHTVTNGDDYARHRIALGIPEGSRDLTIDRALPLEYGYDELHAVDFDKGCYVGQEVTARTKHRATLRKFIHCVEAENPLPARGTPIYLGDREIGTLLSVSGNKGLAHLRVEEAARAVEDNNPLQVLGIAIQPRLPSWCHTSFSDRSA